MSEEERVGCGSALRKENLGPVLAEFAALYIQYYRDKSKPFYSAVVGGSISVDLPSEDSSQLSLETLILMLRVNSLSAQVVV